MINQQRILMFNVSKEKRDKIIQMCKTLGILTKIVDRPKYNQKIGALAEISGFKEDKEIYTKEEFPLEMLVFSGMNQQQVDLFLKEYRKRGIEQIGCKAIITPDNVFWTAEKLFRELLKEHTFIINSPEGNHNILKLHIGMIASLAAGEIDTVTKQKVCSRFLCTVLFITEHFEAYFRCKM